MKTYIYDNHQYYLVDKLITCTGTYELYESCRYGDDIAGIIVKDDTYIDSTYDSLWDWYNELYY